MMSVARGFLLAGVLFLARPGSPPPARNDEASALYRKARDRLRPAAESYGRALMESLESANPYERRLALERLAANRDLLGDAWVPALVRRLSETTPLFDEQCAAMVERLDRSYGGQGEELFYARCKMTGGTSNGTRAAQILGSLTWVPEVVAHVTRAPGTVEAVLASLGPSAGGAGMAAARGLEKAHDPAIEVALLRLALAGSCSAPGPEALAAIAIRFGSNAPAVRKLAPLVYLRLSDCAADDPRWAEPRSAAITAVQVRVGDLGDREIMASLALVGPAAHPLIPALLERMKAKPELRGGLSVLAAIGMSAHAAAPTLVALLGDPSRTPWRGPVLEALARIGSGSSGLKPAALRVLAAEPELVGEVAAALSASAVELTRNELALLERPYRKRCARAGSIFMFNLGRDEDCAKIANSLTSLAERANVCFRASHWRDQRDD